MASRKHHKQDSTRPTKARVKRMRENGNAPDYEMENDSGERMAVVIPATTNGEG